MSTPMEREQAGLHFPFQQAHELVRDLMEPQLPRYWLDLTVSAVLGWAAFALSVHAGPLTLTGLAALALAGLALYRAALFVHELAHLRQRAHIRWFGAGWNLLVGFGLLIPRFMYAEHADHHSKRQYGTARDPEYLAFAQLPRRDMVGVLAVSPLTPLFGPVRFGLLAPLSWCVPGARDWVLTRMSALKLDIGHRSEPSTDPVTRRALVRQEVICCLLVWAAVACVWSGLWSWAVPLAWYLLMLFVVGLNSLRLLGAHRYHGADADATTVSQMVDSVNCSSSRILGRLWGPVGLRQHALHHLFPSLPYHAFPEAHRRLRAALPAGSAYHLTEEPGLLASIRKVWRTPRSAPTVRSGL